MLANLKLMDDFIEGLNKRFPDHTFTLTPLSKYNRVVVQHTKYEDASTAQRSVYCFLDGDTNIYKSAGWAKPAKHVRGNLADDGVQETLTRTDPYGSWLYLR